MCRLVGIVASEVTEFGLALRDAPRSLARLSLQHPDGWGVAAYGGPGSVPPPAPASAPVGWRVHKGTEPAGQSRRFDEIAARSSGTVLIAHVRQKTVGPTRLENTHPFVQSGWVFAHNGTIDDHASLRAASSPARLSEVQGDTDSEVLFAFLLTRLDAAGLTHVGGDPAARDEATRILGAATAELRARRAGAFNFLLSDGASCFIHRFGRSLFLLERTPDDPVRERRSITPGATLMTPWTQRRHAVLVASERLTDEPWDEIPECSLLRVDRDPSPAIVWSRPEERKVVNG